MKTSLGKILLLFRHDQIAGADKIKFLDTHLVMPLPENPNDYSLEVAEIYAVSNAQDFYKPGDKVLVDYTIFQQGKDKTRVKSRTRKYSDVPEGELYYAFDGTDKWNRTEVYAKFDGTTFCTHPSKILVKPAKKDSLGVSAGGIIVKQTENRDQAFWVEVVAGPEGYAAGQEVLVEGGHAQSVYYEGKEIAIVSIEYLMAIRNGAGAGS